MGVFWQDVFYEKLLQYCKHCNRLGHDMSACKLAHPELSKKPPMKESFVPKAPQYVKKTTTQAPNVDKPFSSANLNGKNPNPKKSNENPKAGSSTNNDTQLDAKKMTLPPLKYQKMILTPPSEENVPPHTFDQVVPPTSGPSQKSSSMQVNEDILQNSTTNGHEERKIATPIPTEANDFDVKGKTKHPTLPHMRRRNQLHCSRHF